MSETKKNNEVKTFAIREINEVKKYCENKSFVNFTVKKAHYDALVNVLQTMPAPDSKPRFSIIVNDKQGADICVWENDEQFNTLFPNDADDEAA